MASSKLLINAAPYENRIALIENNTLIEYHLERPAETGLIGNIYLGRVARVLPGMQAAFVDIGLSRTGFLFVGDIIPQRNTSELQVDKERNSGKDDNGNGHVPTEITTLPQPQQHPPIDELLQEGQEVLVQVSKEPIGSKGTRLTCQITLPGRNLVFMPQTDHIGISRKITGEESRQHLRDIVDTLRPEGAGFIVRTVAENADNNEIEADMKFLLLLWDEITAKAAKGQAPELIHQDMDMTLKAVRDLFSDDVQELITDSKEAYKKLLSFTRSFAPHLEKKIHLYENKKTPLFDAYSIEVDIHRILDKKVWLRSGGYIIIEPTEALTVIDVNTGRFVGNNDHAETIFKTNMEAVKEIAYQLRLRNIGGIIIIDFIDMDNGDHREELYTVFQEAMVSDKNKVNILKLSEFGLVEMTRKRSSETLTQRMCDPCPHCAGDGIVKSRRTLCYEIFRKISHNATDIGGSGITIKVHPQLADMLLEEEAEQIERLEGETGKRFTIIPVAYKHIHQYDIIWNRKYSG
jgi:ribonuclease G